MTKPASLAAAASSRGGSKFAARRLYRLLTMSLALAAIIEPIAIVGSITRQAALLSWPYTVLALAVCVLPASVALCGFRRMSIARLRATWRVQAIGMLVVYAAVPVALAGRRMPAQEGLGWMAALEVVAACAAVLAWRTRGTVAYLVVWQSTMFAVAIACCDDPFFGAALADAARQLFYVALFASLTAALLRAGRLLDSVVDRAVDETRATVLADLRRRARRRLDLLVHDRVIVALLAYARGAEATRSAVEAERALEALQGDPPDAGEGGDRSPLALVWELQALTTSIDPDTRFDYEATGERALPAGVRAALVEAFSEALRNSVRHASPARPVTRQVHVSISPDRVETVVLDDGDGFALAEVAPARLGIRYGILERMRSEPGGSAAVHSVIGYGTSVLLAWSRTSEAGTS